MRRLPTVDARLRASALVGAELRGASGDPLGEISDIAFDTAGRPA